MSLCYSKIWINKHLSSRRRAVYERSSKGLQPLKMVTVDMAEKTGERRRPLWILAEVVNCMNFRVDNHLSGVYQLLTLNGGKFYTALESRLSLSKDRKYTPTPDKPIEGGHGTWLRRNGPRLERNTT